MKTEHVHYQLDIPNDLSDKLEIVCVEQDRTRNLQVVAFIREGLKRYAEQTEGDVGGM